MICSSCGQALLSKATGECLGCGARHIKFDTLSFAIGVFAIVMLVVSAIAVLVVMPNYSIGTAATNVITALAYIVSLSTAVDAVILAFRRRKVHKTAAGMVIGIIGVVAGIVLLLHWVINLI